MRSRGAPGLLLCIQHSAFPPRSFANRLIGVRLAGLRIALVILHADPARGGAERYTVDLAAALRGRGHEVALVASTIPPGELPAGAVRLDTGGATRTGRFLHFLDPPDRHFVATHYQLGHAGLLERC